ncbi:6335_t:CDS:2 [Rhizophagus irregularis]|nr:6335_t:CDS:2 [Rhizophagus irregularis]
MVMRAFFFLEIWKDYIKRCSTIHLSKWYNMQRSNAIEFLRTWPSDDDIKEQISYNETSSDNNTIIDNEDDQDQNSVEIQINSENIGTAAFEVSRSC